MQNELADLVHLVLFSASELNSEMRWMQVLEMASGNLENDRNDEKNIQFTEFTNFVANIICWKID